VVELGEVQIVSFDLDGTLIDHGFVDSIWLEGVPRLFATKEKIPLDMARELVKKEYDTVGMERLEWYNMKFWLNKFGLSEDWRSLFDSYRSKIRLYSETMDVLEKLKSENFELILVTNSPKEFLNIELEETGIRKFFNHVFSATSEFGQVKNTADFYLKIASILKVLPSQMIHVGDNWDFDYLMPKKTGMVSFYLDRGKQRKGEWIVHDLQEFEAKLHVL